MTDKKTLPKPKPTPPGEHRKTVRSAFRRGGRVQITCGDENPTKQSFRDECDINNIMAKYQKTGAVAHTNRHAGEYGFASSHDFAESMRIVTTANEMFADLPSSIRSKFANSPENFLGFVQDPANREEMAKMGLLSDEATQRLSEPPKAINEPPQAQSPDAEHPALE